MSKFVKLLVVVLFVNLYCYLAFPELHVAEDLVDKLLLVEKDEQGHIINVWANPELNKSLKIEETNIVPGTLVFLGNSIGILKDFLQIIPNFLLAPFQVLKHCVELGAPPAAAVVVGGGLIGMYVLAVMDFLWAKD